MGKRLSCTCAKKQKFTVISAVLLSASGLPFPGSTPFLTDSGETWNAQLCLYASPMPLGTMLGPHVLGDESWGSETETRQGLVTEQGPTQGSAPIYKMPPEEPLQTSFSKWRPQATHSRMMGWEWELFKRLVLGSLCRPPESKFLRESPANLFLQAPRPQVGRHSQV